MMTLEWIGLLVGIDILFLILTLIYAYESNVPQALKNLIWVSLGVIMFTAWLFLYAMDHCFMLP